MDKLFNKPTKKQKKRLPFPPDNHSNDVPVIYNQASSSRSFSSSYKIDKDLKIKKIGKDFFGQVKKKRENNNYLLARSLNLGYYLITPLLLGIFLGIWIDRFLKTGPFFLLFLFSLGIVGSFYNLWRIVKEN